MVQVNQCAELNNTNCVLSYTSIGDPASNGSWQLSEYSPLHPLPLGRLVKAAALGGQSSIPSQTVWYPEPLDLNRLLLLLAPVVLADPAIAFDGGGFEAEELKFLLISQKQKLLPSIQSFTNPAWTYK